MIGFALRLLFALPILVVLLALGAIALAVEIANPSPRPRHSSLDTIEALLNRGLT